MALPHESSLPASSQNKEEVSLSQAAAFTLDGIGKDVSLNYMRYH
jgi:hypothetical protein